MTELIDRLAAATNAHDVDPAASLVHQNYRGEQPAHPGRAFVGRAQMRANWAAMCAGIPDLRVEVLRSVQDADAVWTEWHWSGTRGDGQRFEMRGVTLFQIADEQIIAGRLYMEELEQHAVGIEQTVHALSGRRPDHDPYRSSDEPAARHETLAPYHAPSPHRCVVDPLDCQQSPLHVGTIRPDIIGKRRVRPPGVLCTLAGWSLGARSCPEGPRRRGLFPARPVRSPLSSCGAPFSALDAVMPERRGRGQHPVGGVITTARVCDVHEHEMIAAGGVHVICHVAAHDSRRERTLRKARFDAEPHISRGGPTSRHAGRRADPSARSGGVDLFASSSRAWVWSSREAWGGSCIVKGLGKAPCCFRPSEFRRRPESNSRTTGGSSKLAHVLPRIEVFEEGRADGRSSIRNVFGVRTPQRADTSRCIVGTSTLGTRRVVSKRRKLPVERCGWLLDPALLRSPMRRVERDRIVVGSRPSCPGRSARRSPGFGVIEAVLVVQAGAAMLSPGGHYDRTSECHLDPQGV
jgi:ketosteroid isomerase-like protein